MLSGSALILHCLHTPFATQLTHA